MTARHKHLPEERMVPIQRGSHYPAFYGLNELPAWSLYTPAMRDAALAQDYVYSGPARWSGNEERGNLTPPEIGDRVDITIGTLGSGEVIGYFTESGFLGLYVVPDVRPMWHKKQNPDRHYCMVFGAEVRPR